MKNSLTGKVFLNEISLENISLKVRRIFYKTQADPSTTIMQSEWSKKIVGFFVFERGV